METPENTKGNTRKKPTGNKSALYPYSTKCRRSSKNHLTTQLSEKPFKCPECPFRAKLKRYIRHHVKNVHLFKSPSSRPFPCPESGCGYAAKEKSELQRHSKIHSGETSFSCSHPNCNFSSNQKGSLIEHTRIHTGEKPFVCQFQSCSYAAAHQSHLVAHSRTHTKEKPFKCPELNCEYSAAQKSNLNNHQLTHEPKEGEERPSFKCPLCEYSGKGKRNLSAHIRRHTLEKHVKCEEPNCNFETKTNGEMKIHKLSVHSDEKPFACPFESCEYRCKHKSTLATHLKTHSDEKRYKCELCAFRAKHRSVVTTHLQNVHSDPNFRPFKCKEPNCDYSAKIKGNLNQHQLIHNGAKNFSCSFPNCAYKGISGKRVKDHQKNFHKAD